MKYRPRQGAKRLYPINHMKNSTGIVLAAVLSGMSLAAAPQTPDQAVDRIIQAVMPPARQQELFNKAADRMADKLAQKNLPPACIDELRSALRDFMQKLVDEGVLTKLATAQFREKLTDEEILTLATFLESSVGQKFVNKTISLNMDKDQLNQELKIILDGKKVELTGVMTRILEKYGVKTR